MEETHYRENFEFLRRLPELMELENALACLLKRLGIDASCINMKGSS